jgi:hypothetical protein
MAKLRQAMPNKSVMDASLPSADRDQTTRLTPTAVETFDERKLLAILNPAARAVDLLTLAEN